MVDEEANQRSYLQAYYAEKGEERNRLWRNDEVLFQVLAYDKSLTQAFGATRVSPPTTRVLDVGCGNGSLLSLLTRLGFDPANVAGVDLIEERVEEAKRLHPSASFQYADASQLPYGNGEFQVVHQSSMLVFVRDEEQARRIALEMIRVCAPGSFLIIADWRYRKPWNENYVAVSRRRIKDLFKVGQMTEIVGVHRGALVPPIGRFLSARLPSAYFLVAALVPQLVGQVAYVLMKKAR